LLAGAADDGTGCSLSPRYAAAVLADAPAHWWRLLDSGCCTAVDCSGSGTAAAGSFSSGYALSAGNFRDLGQPGCVAFDCAAPYSTYFAGGYQGGTQCSSQVTFQVSALSVYLPFAALAAEAWGGGALRTAYRT
jgi:hypothetical protein